MTVYLIDNLAVDSDGVDFQNRLADAHQRRVRPLCTCRDQGEQLAMVLAHVKIKGEDRYIIRRLPDTGHDHAADCRHHEEPEGLSGLTQVRGTAIQHDENDDTFKLRLDFPLGRGLIPGISSSSTRPGGKPTWPRCAAGHPGGSV